MYLERRGPNPGPCDMPRAQLGYRSGQLSTAQVGSGRLRPAQALLRPCSGQGTNGSRSKTKKEIPRLGFGVSISLYYDPNPDALMQGY
jgi:hypothetical protein